MAEGMTNREVASCLFLSVRTVECHIYRALDKLALHNRTQLAAWVSRGGGRRDDYSEIRRSINRRGVYGGSILGARPRSPGKLSIVVD